MAITTQRLKHATALAEHRNFARAAKVLHITQPALSRSIQALEGALGVTLFDRRSGGVELTAFGTLLVQRAGAILFSISELRREIDLLRGRETGEVVLGAGPLVASTALGPALARTSQHFPRLKVHVRLGSADALMAAVRSGDMEFFVADSHEMASEPDVHVMGLLPERVAFFVRTAHPLASRRRVTRTDLMHYPLASPRIPPRFATWLRGERRGNAWWGDFPEPPPAIECENFAVVKTIVAESDAVSAAPISVFATEQAVGTMKELRVEMPEWRSAIGIVSLRHRTLSPAALTLIEFLIEADRHRTAE
jgi:DNA-binding transcriptional LysR family regulator